MNFGCWNVQGIATKDMEVYEELKRSKMDAVVLSETMKKGRGNEIKGE